MSVYLGLGLLHTFHVGQVFHTEEHQNSYKQKYHHFRAQEIGYLERRVNLKVFLPCCRIESQIKVGDWFFLVRILQVEC